MDEVDERKFIFVGEVMVLDVINTVKMVRGTQQDLLQTPHDLEQWMQAAIVLHPELAHIGGPFNQTLFESVKALRDHLRALFLRVIDGQMPGTADVGFLNAIMQHTHPVLTWLPNETPHVHYQHDDAVSDLVMAMALSALHLLTEGDLSRLRQCQRSQIGRCVLLFYDTTKSGTRQWCSTACLDRDRSARRYEEKKQKGKS